jgi:hypothetical protein
MTYFQIKLSGAWKDYSKDEDKILKRAFLAGFSNAKFSYHRQTYEVNFKDMTQKNVTTGKSRTIRPPYKLKPPSAPVTKPGPTMCVKVPPGSKGTTISVPHPKDKTQMIQVDVPKDAKDGQAMLVPIPPLEDVVVATPAATPAAPAAAPAAEAAPAAAPAAEEKKGWSTGAKVAAGTAGVAAVAGLAVAGAVLGEHIAEEGLDATLADLGDAFEGVGEAIVDGAEAAADWTTDAAEDAGDFIMDLF